MEIKYKNHQSAWQLNRMFEDQIKDSGLILGSRIQV